MEYTFQSGFGVNTKVHSQQKTVLRGNTLSLPAPQKEYTFGDAHFFLYKVKDSSQKNFPEPALYELLCEARRSYLRYGNVALTDEYDQKSSIYITRVVYPHQVDNVTFFLEEWVSVRFVPAAGNPVSTEDLDACIFQNKTISKYFENDLFQTESNPLKNFTTISRICRIAPRVPAEDLFFAGTFLPQKNSHTALAFTLMNEAFLCELSQKGEEPRYLTAFAREELFEKVLHFPTHTTRLFFPLYFAEKVLDLKQDEHIRVNHSLLSYKHPGYFLNLQELMLLFEKLIQFGRLSERSLQKHFETNICFQELQEKHKKLSYQEFLPYVEGLSRFLLTDGWIEGSRMHGTELRSLIDLCVRDAVHLYMSPISLWKQGIDSIMKEFFGTSDYENKTIVF